MKYFRVLAPQRRLSKELNLFSQGKMNKGLFYKIKLFAQIYIFVYILYIYMLARAGQMTGPTWLIFFRKPTDILGAT